MPYVDRDVCERHLAGITNKDYTLTKAMICVGETVS